MRIQILLLLMLCSWAASAVGLAAPPTKSIPTREFFRQYGFRDASISPDGRLVAAIVNPNGGRDQLLLRLADQNVGGSVYTVDNAGDSISHLQWISDDILVFYVFDKHGNQSLDAVRWLGTRGGKPQAHVSVGWGYKASLVDPLLNRGSHALVASHTKDESFVYDIDFSDLHDQMNPQHVVASIDGYAFLWMTDQSGKVRVVGTYGSNGKMDYSILRPGTGHWLQFKVVKPGKIFAPISYAPNGQDLIVETNMQLGTLGLWTYDPFKDRFIKKIYANNEYDIDYALYDWSRYRVTGVAWHEGPVQKYSIFDPSLKQVQDALQHEFPGFIVSIVSEDRDGQRVIALISNAQNPGTYYVYDARAHKSFEVGTSMPWIPEGTFVAVRSSSVLSSDGLKIEYLVALPTISKGPFPVVVMPHGGPLGIEDTLSFDPGVQFLANRGYAVVQVNYRGSSGEGRKFYDAGKKQWGEKIEDDIATAVQAALSKYPLDASRVCIYGGSYGGYSAVMSVIRFPSMYKCAASFAGVMDVPLLYETSDWATNRYLRQLMKDIVGNPDTQSKHLYDISPVYNASRLTRPIFIAQGAKDQRVDQEQAYRMRAVLKRLGKTYKFKIYQNEGHGFQYLDDDVDFHDRLIRFLNKSLKERHMH